MKKIDLALKFHRFKEALQLAFQLDEQHPKEEQIECRLAFSLLFIDSEGDKNIDRAMALIEPYLQKSHDDEMKKLINADVKDMDEEHVKQLFMQMLSTMMKKSFSATGSQMGVFEILLLRSLPSGERGWSCCSQLFE